MLRPKQPLSWPSASFSRETYPRPLGSMGARGPDAQTWHLHFDLRTHHLFSQLNQITQTFKPAWQLEPTSSCPSFSGRQAPELKSLALQDSGLLYLGYQTWEEIYLTWITNIYTYWLENNWINSLLFSMKKPPTCWGIQDPLETTLLLWLWSSARVSYVHTQRKSSYQTLILLYLHLFSRKLQCHLKTTHNTHAILFFVCEEQKPKPKPPILQLHDANLEKQRYFP